MKSNSVILTILVVVGSLFVLAFAGWSHALANGEIAAAPTSTAAMQPTEERLGVIIDLPAGATQKEIGKEVYRLTCSACHAYDGSGLTDEWRSTWNPADQNCWQSKCHGDNHPDDGFYLPPSPAIVGDFFPQVFPTALDVYNYVNATMPWHNPGMLPKDQAWAVTAHVLVLNGFDPGDDLNPESAAVLRLQPQDSSAVPSSQGTAPAGQQIFIPLAESVHTSATAQQSSPYWLYSLLGLSVLAGLGWIITRVKNKE
jgi:cytochrome c5